MKNLPEFNVTHYEHLLRCLLDSSYEFEICSNLKNVLRSTGKTCFLRHDVDLHLLNINRIGEIENKLGIKSTYFILLSSFYNILESQNKKILQTLVGQGHEIGLHYDLAEYPINNFDESLETLKLEVQILEKVTKAEVKSIVMHKPYIGMPDIFKESGIYNHPHCSQWNDKMVYISDSCRAWRDKNLLNCVNDNRIKNLHLNLHPELWLGTEEDSIEFLNKTVYNTLNKTTIDFINEYKEIWQNHDATLLQKLRLNNEISN